MSIERVFLGWDRPALPAVAQWLHREYGGGDIWDLSSVLIAVPGARAGRRLMELLVYRAADDRPLVPPRIITAGQLPDLLFEPDRGVADPLYCLLARVESIRHCGAESLRALVGHPLEAGDLHGHLALGRQLQGLHESLAADAVRIDQVGTACETLPDFRGEQRWRVLADLQRAYDDLLGHRDRVDPHAARLEAVAQQRCRCGLDLVLAATVDLNRTTSQMIGQLDSPVTALVHAPREEADRFDEMGCLDADRWVDGNLDLERAALRIVDRPRDQAAQVLTAIAARLDRGDSAIAGVDQITVGLGDETLGPIIARTLDLNGLGPRLPAAAVIEQSRPATLLTACARFVQQQRLDDFAALMRHPDLQGYLRHELGGEDDAVTDWLTLLDNYASDHLPGRLSDQWLGDPARSGTLKRVYDAVVALLPAAPRSAAPLPQWSQPIAEVLARVYGTGPLRSRKESDRQLIAAIEALAGALREQSLLDADDELTPRLDAADAIQLTLSQVAGSTIPHEGGTPAIEMLGWLELQLDDAPMLLITAVNEGAIPQNRTSDSFLPDALRSHLGLADDRRRYARDLYMMTAIVNSRPDVTLIAGRRSADNDPLMPSRLLLACDGPQRANRVAAFYSDRPGDAENPSALMAINHGETSRFIVPPPTLPDAPIEQLPVTAFGVYLDCPYRFYLRYVCGLRAVDDRATELDGPGFGMLAHEVLDRFARHGSAANSPDADAIEELLMTELDHAVGRRFGAGGGSGGKSGGESGGAAVRIQVEQLRHRLRALAKWQAAQVEQGWRIMAGSVERKATAPFEVDGLPFAIRGRIDRIDRHDDGRYRLLDYKTGETGHTPDQVHLAGAKADRQWVDLQLPLYRVLAHAQGLKGELALGYVLLPKDPAQVGEAMANWDESQFEGAIERARYVVRQVRNSIFWPPKQPVGPGDEFSAVCMDHCLDRAAALAAGQAGPVNHECHQD